MRAASFAALVTAFALEGDAAGTRHTPREHVWLEAASEAEMADRMHAAVERATAEPGSMAELGVLARGDRLLWSRGFAHVREVDPAAARIIEAVHSRIAAPDLDFLREAVQFARMASPGNPARVTYRNPPTVAVMLVPTDRGLLMVRRGLSDGYGKRALPGGHQEPGETWQQAGAREVLEETGAVIDPSSVRIVDAVTVPSGHNLLFGICRAISSDFVARTDSETLEVCFASGPVETAFPAHTRAVARHFAAGTAY